MSEFAPISDRFWQLLDAACDGTLMDEESSELATLLEADPGVRKLFLDHIQLRTDIRFLVRADRARDLGLGRVNALLHPWGGAASPVQDGWDSSAEAGESPIVIVVDSPVASYGQPSSGFASLAGYFTQVGPFSYLMSALLMCVAVFAAWQFKMSAVQQYAGQRSSSPRSVAVAPSSVCSITNMSACRWTGESKPSSGGSNPELAIDSTLQSGRRLSLDSGLLEIAYASGASVILQGPVVFEVASNGGFLHVGRLTGRLDGGLGVGGQGAEIHHQRSQTSDPSPPATAFSIRTPTATVTDLGTEFGVEVDSLGRTTSCVFRGSVLLSLAAPASPREEVVLTENKAAIVSERGQSGIRGIRPVDVDMSRFVRRVPRGWAPIAVFGTGVDVRPGLRDAHWQVVACSADPTFQLQDAVVVSYSRRKWTPHRQGYQVGPEEGLKEQWISSHGVWNSPLPPGSTCTFRTSFGLETGAVETAVVRGRFRADKRVQAIRLNGQDVSVSEPDVKYEWERGGPILLGSFTVDHGFVDGNNVLEIDVEADEAPDNYPEMEALGMKSALGLRVSLEGSWRLPSQEGGAAD